MKTFFSSFGLLACSLIASPAIAQACEGEPTSETLESAEKITQLLENGLVQFGGYMAMISYASSRDDCVKSAVFEDLYVTAVDLLPESRMNIWRDWAVSPLDLQLNAASSVEGFGGSCRIRFDLPRAGAPENVSVSCDNPMLKSAYRTAWNNLVFAPPTLNEGFKPAENVEVGMSLTQRIDDWAF